MCIVITHVMYGGNCHAGILDCMTLHVYCSLGSARLHSCDILQLNLSLNSDSANSLFSVLVMEDGHLMELR